MKQICPIMSTVLYHPIKAQIEEVLVPCKDRRCQLWVNAYTTEGRNVEGCAYELAPQMHEGVFRV